MKAIVGVLLLPLCAGGVLALLDVVAATGRMQSFWLAMAGGLACWWVVFLLLPKPMLVYVFGHELTHVLWTWLFGGRVRKFKVTSRGGHVVISRSNFLVALAPYFFPLYVLIVTAVYAVGNHFWNWSHYVVWFHWLVGMAYGFHLTLTWHILQARQTDITGQGWFFSTVVIFLGNVLVLLVGLPFLTERVGVLGAIGWWFHETGSVLLWLRSWL